MIAQSEVMEDERQDKGDRFPRTRWSIVAQVQSADGKEARAALETLCRQYWYPVYAYVRWLGENPENAEDATQGFFARLLEREYLEDVAEGRGKLRTFICLMVKLYVIDERRIRNAQKRGGGSILIPIDGREAESRFANEPADHDTPERLFEKRWASTVIERVLDLLGEEYAARGRGQVFEAIRKYLMWNTCEDAQAETAEALGMNVGAIRMSVVRMRQRYAELLREEIAETLEEGECVEDECRYLFSLFQES